MVKDMERKVEGHPGYVRDGEFGVVKNVNRDGFEAYIMRRDAARVQNNRTESLEKEVAELRDMLQKALSINS
ncbi:coil containing protein [Vibrio phage 1.244.A._10N.261.54.C3]|nr:coil containing protein [Vibrio phage 1.244.A._10N.261.54.C3]AUR98835.1 coil containing protein [Vibrio phage 1.255.O._10N.286.45.F1]